MSAGTSIKGAQQNVGRCWTARLWGCSIRSILVAVSLLTVSFIVNNSSVVEKTTTYMGAPSSSSTRLSNNLIMAHKDQYWTKYRSQNLPLGVRIAFQLRDTGEFGIRTDDPCYKEAEDKQRGWNRTMYLPPTLIDVRSARQWEAGLLDSASKSRIGAQEVEDVINDRGGRILDFSTSVATDLKILFLGDSVAAQIGRAFDSAATGIPDIVALAAAKEGGAHVNSTILPPNPRVVIENFSVGGMVRDCIFASAPVRGGGAVAMWRVVKLLSMSRINTATCNSPKGGWNEQQLLNILEHKYNDPKRVEENNNNTVSKIGKFDAVVLRIQLGWMRPGAITHEGIIETIELCRTLIGAETVVIMTINFTNDVHDKNEWKWAAKTNEWIREQARTINQNATSNGSKFRVLVMEFSDFTTQVHWANARTIRAPSGSDETYEYSNLNPPNLSIPNYEQEDEADFLFDRFKKWHVMNKHPHSIPTVCSRMGDKFVLKEENFERRQCERNAIMKDGLHWCMTSVGPRYHAGLSCLLGCVYNDAYEGSTEYEDSNSTIRGMELCERSCNEQFMGLRPIDESWLDQGNTLFSVPGS